MTDRIAAYAIALQSDINTERFQVVENGKLQTYWMGTVYGGGVATDAGFKFRTPEEAWDNASLFVEQCAEIVSERINKKGGSMTDRELMQQALEALEEFCEHQTMLRPIEKRDALRERLAQPTCNCNMRTRLVGDGCEVCNPERARELAQPEQEPVAWVDERAISWLAGRRNKSTAHITTGLSAEKCLERPMPLYTTPLQRKPLTDKDVRMIWDSGMKYAPGEMRVQAFARAIERAHGIGEKE